MNELNFELCKNADGSIDLFIGRDLVDITVNFKDIQEVHAKIFMQLRDLYEKEGNLLSIKKIIE